MEAAHRDARSVFHCAPSPSGRSMAALLEMVAGGIPYPWILNFVPWRAAHSCIGARNRSLRSSVSVWPQSWRMAAVAGPASSTSAGRSGLRS